MNVSKPPIPPERFEACLKQVLPPECKLSSGILAWQRFELTQEQLQRLVDANNAVLRYYTDREYAAKINNAWFDKAEKDHGRGWMPNSFAKNK